VTLLRGLWRWALAASALAIVATSCSTANSARPGPAVINSGQLPPSALLVGGAGGAGKSAQEATGTTIPLAKQDPTTALFTAIGVFQSCLKGLGVTFAGAPNPNNPNSPTNNPSYLKSLGTCAAQSHILQALKAEQSAQEDLTPAQVVNENKIYIKWRVCMISRGWKVPEPKPNELTPPPGESLLSSPDINACVALAQQGKS
jgi:hypothetical protein